MRLPLHLIVVLVLGACGSSAPDDDASGNTGGITVELPPPTPFQPENAAVPATNLASDETQANITDKAETKIEEATTKAAPPAVPKEAAAPPPRTEPAPQPKAKAESDAGDVRLLPDRVPLPDAAIARTIERIGFPCGTVVSSNRVEAAGGNATYKIVCSSGASYQGTNKGGRLFFREWTGKLTRD